MNDNTKSNSDITNVVLPKKLHEYDEPHRGDTSNFVIENDDRKEEYNSNQMFEVQVDEGAECKFDVAEKQDLIGEPLSVNPDS
ncbi:hypothetical protein P3S67_012382 [Capsicum chacoense]